MVFVRSKFCLRFLEITGQNFKKVLTVWTPEVTLEVCTTKQLKLSKFVSYV